MLFDNLVFGNSGEKDAVRYGCKTLATVLILTIAELLVDNASVPAGGPFIVLLPAGGPFTFWPLVDNASVTAGGPLRFCSTYHTNTYHTYHACKSTNTYHYGVAGR